MEMVRVKWGERAEDGEWYRTYRQSPDIDAGATTTHLPVWIAGHGGYDVTQLWWAELPAFNAFPPWVLGRVRLRLDDKAVNHLVNKRKSQAVGGYLTAGQEERRAV